MEVKKIKKQPVVDIYWRKLGFFLVLFLLFFGAWQFIAGSRFLADTSDIQPVSTYLTSSDVSLEVRDDGSVYKNGKKITSKIKPEKDFDELRLIVFDKNGFYLDNLRVTLNLPAAVSAQTKPEILAIHGVDSASSIIIDEKTILYEAKQVGESATITIVAKLPKGTINLSFYEQTIFLLSSFGSSVWLTIAVIIPLITLIYLILLVVTQRSAQSNTMPDRGIAAPPAALPPAVAGVLYGQKVGPREIAATLIDLSLRGYIFIIDRDRGFAFGKRNFFGQLLSFEKILLSKIFRDNIKISEEEVAERFANHLYSHKMSVFSNDVYALATRLGYFKVNPISMHRKYQFTGTLLFFFALACFFLTFKYFPSLPYAVFLWVGMMLSSLIIIVVGSRMPIKTALGRQALTNWLAFKKYLSDPQPLPPDQMSYEKFIHYLPYAIIFHSEALWVRRFSEQEFVVPDWFLSDKQGLGLHDFCLALFPIIGYIGQNLASIREPGYN